MKAKDEKAKAKSPRPTVDTPIMTEKERLEPCAKPQAEEAARLNDADDACDEGVH